MDRMAIEERLAVLAHFHLRGPSGFLAARDRGWRTLAYIRGVGRPAHSLFKAHELYASGTHAGNGASVRRLLGIPDAGIFCGDQPVRIAGRLHDVCRSFSSGRNRRTTGLDSGALPE